MRFLAALIALAVVAAACGSDDETAATITPPPSTTTTRPPSSVLDSGNRTEVFTPGEVVRIVLPRSTPEVTDADIAAVVDADTALGLDVFRMVAGDENLMISPYSIATALSMVYPGARGITATEMTDVLGLTVDDATLHAVRNYIDTALANPPVPVSDEDTREPFTIRPANSAWGQGGYPFLDEYLGVLAENYGAGLRLLDYIGDPGGSRVIINEWVEDATEDRIKDLLQQGDIDDLTRLVLVNAIWFKANWASPFDPDATSPGMFTLLDDSKIEVPLMKAFLETSYASNRELEAVRLPYAGDAAMVVVLPKNGSPADLAAALDSGDLDLEWERARVELTMPSFEFDATVGLNEALKDLGMPTAFKAPWTLSPDEADFSGMTGFQELYISKVRHKTFIALDEEGTEAAAATAVVMAIPTSGGGPQLRRVTFTADRPFLFWIEHSSTGEMLFLGQVTNPA